MRRDVHFVELELDLQGVKSVFEVELLRAGLSVLLVCVLKEHF